MGHEIQKNTNKAYTEVSSDPLMTCDNVSIMSLSTTWSSSRLNVWDTVSIMPSFGSLYTQQQQQHPFNGPFQGLPRWAGTRKAKPIWILQKQETVSGSGISWAICKSASHSRQITTPAPHHSVFYRPDALPATQPTVSKHRTISS